MDFRGKKFEYVEITEGIEGNRNRFVTLSEAEKLVWINRYKNQAWRSIYAYPFPESGEFSYAGYYFESDIRNFDLNRKVILFAVNHLHVNYDIPLEAFKFKFTNKSVWVEIAPSIMGISPSKNLNETFKNMTITLNKTLLNTFGIKNPLDINVYGPRQLTRLTGSYLPKTKRYVIDLKYSDLRDFTLNEILALSHRKRKLTYFGNFEFDVSSSAASFYKKHIKREKPLEEPLFNVIGGDRKCIDKIKKEGVEQGQRNNALFYTAIHLKEKGLTAEQCTEELLALNASFDQHKVDSISKVMATARSVYKKDYRFSCSKMNEFFPDQAACEGCVYQKQISDDHFKVYKNQLAALFKIKAKKNDFKVFLKKSFGETLSTKEDKSISDLPKAKGSYFTLPKFIYEKLIHLDSEIILFFEILKSSPNGKILNPKLETKHYAKRLSVSIRSIQRYMALLIEKGLICDGQIILKEETVLEESNEISETSYEEIYFIKPDMLSTLFINSSDTG